MDSINWDAWEDAKRAARNGLWMTLNTRHRSLREDMIEDVALRLLTDGWNIRWRIADMMQQWFGKGANIKSRFQPTVFKRACHYDHTRVRNVYL
jgi:hypothetical protein